MSTFNGKMNEYQFISIDRFDEHNLTSTAYFLSHCHTDHMKGLDDNKFFERLKENPEIKFYCSEITKMLLKNWAWNEEVYQRLHPFTHSLPINESNVIVIPGDDSSQEKEIVVTLLPAAHCYGSVMFLFEGSEGTVLYTGDFRFASGSTAKMKCLHEGSKVKSIKGLYVDTTFCVPNALYFPTREQSLNALISVARDWLQKSDFNVLYLSCSAQYGYEFLFIGLYHALKMKVHVDEKKLHQYSGIPELGEAVTADCQESRLHACYKKVNNNFKMGDLPCEYSVSKPVVLTVKLSAWMWTTTDMFKNNIVAPYFQGKRICFSTHSSLSEIANFVNYLNPTNIYPNVVPEGSSAEKVLKILDDYRQESSSEESLIENFVPLGYIKRPHLDTDLPERNSLVFDLETQSSQKLLQFSLELMPIENSQELKHLENGHKLMPMENGNVISDQRKSDNAENFEMISDVFPGEKTAASSAIASQIQDVGEQVRYETHENSENNPISQKESDNSEPVWTFYLSSDSDDENVSGNCKHANSKNVTAIPNEQILQPPLTSVSQNVAQFTELKSDLIKTECINNSNASSTVSNNINLENVPQCGSKKVSEYDKRIINNKVSEIEVKYTSIVSRQSIINETIHCSSEKIPVQQCDAEAKNPIPTNLRAIFPDFNSLSSGEIDNIVYPKLGLSQLSLLSNSGSLENEKVNSEVAQLQNCNEAPKVSVGETCITDHTKTEFNHTDLSEYKSTVMPMLVISEKQKPVNALTLSKNQSEPDTSNNSTTYRPLSLSDRSSVKRLLFQDSSSKQQDNYNENDPFTELESKLDMNKPRNAKEEIDNIFFRDSEDLPTRKFKRKTTNNENSSLSNLTKNTKPCTSTKISWHNDVMSSDQEPNNICTTKDSKAIATHTWKRLDMHLHCARDDPKEKRMKHHVFGHSIEYYSEESDSSNDKFSAQESCSIDTTKDSVRFVAHPLKRFDRHLHCGGDVSKQKRLKLGDFGHPVESCDEEGDSSNDSVVIIGFVKGNDRQEKTVNITTLSDRKCNSETIKNQSSLHCGLINNIPSNKICHQQTPVKADSNNNSEDLDATPDKISLNEGPNEIIDSDVTPEKLTPDM